MFKTAAPHLRSISVGKLGTEIPGSGTQNISSHDAETVVTQLYQDYSAFILSYVTRLVKDRHLAEDVVQETMLRAWRHCGQFSDEKGSVRGWLIKVAHNIAVDKIRRRESRPAEVAHSSASLALVEDHADSVLTALQVRQALARLSPEHRAIIEQLYFNGCTAREASERLGIPEGTAFSRAFYALRTMRRELDLARPETEHQAA
jgi:RNA polymerase sigma-70 factor (ECF subfamily)